MAIRVDFISRMTLKRSSAFSLFVGTALVAAGLGSSVYPGNVRTAAAAPPPNAIQVENANAGDPTWDQFASVANQSAISGYGSSISVNRGNPIDFFVTTTAASVTIDIFRTGWYGGVGARKVASLGTFPGVHQVIPSPKLFDRRHFFRRQIFFSNRAQPIGGNFLFLGAIGRGDAPKNLRKHLIEAGKRYRELALAEPQTQDLAATGRDGQGIAGCRFRSIRSSIDGIRATMDHQVMECILEVPIRSRTVQPRNVGFIVSEQPGGGAVGIPVISTQFLVGRNDTIAGESKRRLGLILLPTPGIAE